MAARLSLNARVASGQDSTHKAGFYTRGDVLRERRSDELRFLCRARLAEAAWRLDPFAIKLDAIAPDDQPAMVRAAIEQHLSPDRFKILQAAEASERELIAGLVGKIVNEGAS